MNTICIVKIIYYVTDFNFQVNIQTRYKRLNCNYRKKKETDEKIGEVKGRVLKTCNKVLRPQYVKVKATERNQNNYVMLDESEREEGMI